jgi:hypothetical protein
VNVPKIGSRDGHLCFGGIQRFYAELRREIKRGNFNLVFFRVLLEGPRETIEVGGHSCARFGGILCLEEFNCALGGFCEVY